MNKDTFDAVHDDHPGLEAAPSRHFDVLIIGAASRGSEPPATWFKSAAHHLRTPRSPECDRGHMGSLSLSGRSLELPTCRRSATPFVRGATRKRSRGPSILRYLAETTKAYGVDRHIRFA